MEDQKKNLQPVVAVSEAWHLAQVQAFERAVSLINAARPSAEATMSLEEFCSLILSQLDGEAGAARKTYLRHADRLLGGDLVGGLTVEFDEARSMPLVEWPEDGPQGWGIVDLECELGQDMVLAVPFRPVDVDRLPLGRLIIKLHDPYHAATAALVEVLQCAYRDATSAFIAPDPRSSWRRLHNVINLYRQAARFGLESLGEDDYIGWRPALPSGFEIGTAASLICQVAGTARAQCSMATHLMATWLQALADATEDLPGAERQSAFLSRLKQASEGVETALSGMNRALAQASWRREVEYDCMVIFRPIPKSIPVLAVVPRAQDTVTRMPRRKPKK